MKSKFEYRIINSARWAAYGDALGFISELTDARGLLRRLGRNVDLGGDEGAIPWGDLPVEAWPLQRTVDWRRRVGGRQGAFVSLPAGTYSDDTQLRLATCRAIGAGQGFDPEVFAKVELPVWLSYSLGAGRASKHAAGNLARGGKWLANTYSGWTDAGGNGVVIRVQPHAWEGAKSKRSSYDVMLEVLKNGLSTHGHPRALASACVYADLLLQVLRKDRDQVALRDIQYAVEHASRIPELLMNDLELARYTIPAWEGVAAESFGDSWNQVIKEMIQRVDQLAELSSSGLDEGQRVDQYFKLLGTWGLFEDEQRGSGVGTLFAALALLFLFPGDLDTAIRVACGAINSDTDSIATVYGGIAGALISGPSELPGRIQDDRYIVREAARIAGIDRRPNFQYPDLLHWQPPQTQADSVLLTQGRKFLTGLGYVESEGPVFEAGGGFNWQWLLLEFGQNVLVKQRENPREVIPGIAGTLLPTTNVGLGRPPRMEDNEVRGDEEIAERLRKASDERKPSYQQQALLDLSDSPRVSQVRQQERPVESAIREARASGMDNETVGRLLLELSREVSIDAAVAFAAIISQAARNTRQRRNTR
ncbi:ADP-ribosylglycohydrolase family protein [Streptomyces sp. NPDC059582]|uniref:ADP-ribosylglycohydrolase family protein n=1 Tax=Streptomyces sp. NPDC059582 TaxID=3346875 RepID=UPI00367E31B8